MKVVGLEKLNNFHFGHFFIGALDQREILFFSLTPRNLENYKTAPAHSSFFFLWLSKQGRRPAAVRRGFCPATVSPARLLTCAASTRQTQSPAALKPPLPGFPHARHTAARASSPARRWKIH